MPLGKCQRLRLNVDHLAINLLSDDVLWGSDDNLAIVVRVTADCEEQRCKWIRAPVKKPSWQTAVLREKVHLYQVLGIWQKRRGKPQELFVELNLWASYRTAPLLLRFSPR